MIIPRAQIDDALFALVSSTQVYPWTYTSKHWQAWDNTSNQPALYLKRVKEMASQTLRGENRWVLHYEIWVYAQFQATAPDHDPYDDLVNPILEALDTAIQPVPPNDWQNLGIQQVGNCRINGQIDIADGSLDGQVVLVVPVEVFVSV